MYMGLRRRLQQLWRCVPVRQGQRCRHHWNRTCQYRGAHSFTTGRGASSSRSDESQYHKRQRAPEAILPRQWIPNLFLQALSLRWGHQRCGSGRRHKPPVCSKLCREGYDGKGVKVVSSLSDLPELLQGESLVEDLVDIDKELAIIVARNESGETKAFTAVEMTFNPQANLVEYLLCPARIDPSIEEAAEKWPRLSSMLLIFADCWRLNFSSPKRRIIDQRSGSTPPQQRASYHR